MEIILREDVSGLGHKGEMLDVADGYARNYLVPRGFAMQATLGAAGQAESMRKARDVRSAKERAAGDEIARVLVPTVINLAAKSGAGGKLYGSVTTSDVAEAVKAQTGIELDRRQLSIEAPIREIGSYQVSARLHANVQFFISIEVAEA
ncbi:MAG: 50S ribosomal protein L9 [Acidimicrobiales bacterium]